MQTKQNRPPGTIKIIIKICIASTLAMLCVYAMAFTVFYVAHENASDDMGDALDSCNYYYYEQQYGQLRESMLLFDTYDEAFDMYWEIVDGYSDYQQYQQWAATPEDKVPESTEMTEIYRQKVIDNARNCKFEQNQRKLSEYAENIE